MNIKPPKTDVVVLLLGSNIIQPYDGDDMAYTRRLMLITLQGFSTVQGSTEKTLVITTKRSPSMCSALGGSGHFMEGAHYKLVMTMIHSIQLNLRKLCLAS